jgi:hypothetical protein
MQQWMPTFGGVNEERHINGTCVTNRASILSVCRRFSLETATNVVPSPVDSEKGHESRLIAARSGAV